MNNLKEQDSQDNDAFILKNKRDQYVYEIRKQKTEDIIKTKRLKLSSTLGQKNLERNTGMVIPGQNGPQTMEQQEKVSESFQELTREFFNGVSNNDLMTINNIVQTIRHKISENDTPPIAELLDTGLFPHLVKLLGPEYKDCGNLQFEVIWVITNVFTADEKLTAKIITKQLVEILVNYIWHKQHDLVEQVFWALGNLSGDSNQVRLMLLEAGVLEHIAKFMKTLNMYSENLVRCISWIISNLAMLRESHEKLYPLFPVIEQLLKQNDPEVCSYACWTYSHLTNVQNDQIFNTIMTHDFLKRIVNLLETSNTDIKRPAIRTVGNILSGKSAHTKRMFDAGCLDKLEAVMEHRKPLLRKEAIWAISNLLAESSQILSKILPGSLFARLLSIIIMDVTPIKLEALICFINALNVASITQAESIIKMGLIRVIPQVLSSTNADLILAGLECLDSILAHGKKVQEDEGMSVNPYLINMESEDVIRHLEELQGHPSNDIYKKVSKVIEAYFEVEQSSV